jgi:hypothetical protein
LRALLDTLREMRKRVSAAAGIAAVPAAGKARKRGIMSRWEYITVIIEYDKKQKAWVGWSADGTRMAGLQEILNDYGTHGWELLSVQAEGFQAYPGLGKWNAEPSYYRATFKRQLEE